MNGHHFKYVLIGGGLASSSAAQAIREADHEGSILLAAQEIVRPYHRPPLSKEFLRRQKPREEIFTQESQWFEKNHVELRTGCRAARLDVARNAVTLVDGQVISYEKLLLATGASAKPLEIPGSDLPNLYYLRSLEDSTRLQTAADKARHEGRPHAEGRGRIAIIGAGFLGTELAASFVQMGLSVDLLCGSEAPWGNIVGDAAGKFLTRYLEARGVRVRPNARPLRLEGDGRVQRVVLPDGHNLECDFAIAAVGTVAHRELLRGTPIAAEKAILTDEFCRTNVANVFAAGDCAAIFDPLFGKHRMIPHWDNANATGALAGRNMAGANEPYKAVNNFFSDIFDLTINGWGEARFVDRRLIRGAANGSTPAAGFAEIGIASDGRVAQTVSFGMANQEKELADLVARRANVAGLEEQLKDPSAPIAKK